MTLSPRQRDVARLVADGMTDAQIARELGCGQTTIRVHVRNIVTHLRIRHDRNTRVEIARWWWQQAA